MRTNRSSDHFNVALCPQGPYGLLGKPGRPPRLSHSSCSLELRFKLYVFGWRSSASQVFAVVSSSLLRLSWEAHKSGMLQCTPFRHGVGFCGTRDHYQFSSAGQDGIYALEKGYIRFTHFQFRSFLSAALAETEKLRQE